jgi:hypothetical protein
MRQRYHFKWILSENWYERSRAEHLRSHKFVDLSVRALVEIMKRIFFLVLAVVHVTGHFAIAEQHTRLEPTKQALRARAEAKEEIGVIISGARDPMDKRALAARVMDAIESVDPTTRKNDYSAKTCSLCCDDDYHCE